MRSRTNVLAGESIPMITRGNAMRTLEVLQELKQKTAETMMPSWLRNMRLNAPYVEKDFTKLPDVLEQNISADTVFVFAPGPSLSQYEGRIHEISGLVVGTPTVVPWMLANNITPDFVVVVDTHPSMSKLLSDYKGPIVCPPTIDHAIVSLPNEKYWFRLLMGTDGTQEDPEFGWWNFVTHKMWDNLSAGFVSLGCVTNMAVAMSYDFLAKRVFRGRRVVLMGADYAYWKEWSRVSPDGKMRPRPLEIDAMEWGGFQTNARMVYYAWALYRLWRATNMPLYSMSEGILKELPGVTFDEVLAGQYPDRLDPDEIQERTDRFFETFKQDFGKKVEDE